MSSKPCPHHRTKTPHALPPRDAYSCPMHPEVQQSFPGDCPICGMALEPRLPTPTAETAEYQQMRNVRQNLFLAFFYNGLSVPIAAGVLYPFTGLLLNPVIASAAMICSSLSVVLNALRLKTRVATYIP